MVESQPLTVLGDSFYNNPSQLSQALRQRAGSDNPLHFSISDNAVSEITFAVSQHPSLDAPPLQFSIAPAPVTCAPSPRRVETVNYVKPALPKHYSAPTSTEAVAQQERALKMHHSFSGADAPGDTQPDSQMHKRFTSGVFPVPAIDIFRPGPKSLFTEQEEDDDEDDDLLADEMDEVGSSPEHNYTTVTSPTAVDMDDGFCGEQNSLALTSPLKFETPALAGRKRDNSGQLLSSAVRTNTTPGTVASASAFGAAFGNGPSVGGPLMSLTQAWHNTQAPTSPAVGGASEDAVFTRPSPNFTNVRHSSPIPAYSSPIKAVRPETPRSDPIPRSSSEPRAEYVTMEESQEKRKLSTDGEHFDTDKHDSWNDLSRQIKVRKVREQFHRKAARSLSYVSAPILDSPQLKRTRKVTARSSSPVKPKVPPNWAKTGSRDEGADSANEPELVKDRNIEEFYNELSEHVFSANRPTVKHHHNENSIQVPKTSSHPHRTPSSRTSRESSQQPTPSSQLQRESQLRAPRSQQLFRDRIQPQSSKDSVAVMDSQPDTIVDFDSIPPPKSLRFPSSPSTNQYSISQAAIATKTGYTSQIISSSIPLLPPKSSSQDVAPEAEVMPAEEERVPSSPPLFACEDACTDTEDLEYDEHSYDECGEDLVNHEVIDSSPADGDTVIDEDQDLPVAKAEAEIDEVDRVVANATDEGHGLDSIQPQKVDMGTDQEIPEILDHEQYDNNVHDSEGAVEIGLQRDLGESLQESRMLRQNTVPETDALDEIQPSIFPAIAPPGTHASGLDVLNHTNSTEAFQTAHEEQSASQTNVHVPVSSKEDGSDAIGAPNRIQSLSDIHNLPDTQQSHMEEEIEMPRLSGLDEDEARTLIPTLSPTRPRAKRRKVTYTVKHTAFRSPTKLSADSNSLSDPTPSPPLEQPQVVPEASPSKASSRKREDEGALAAARIREDTQTRYRKPAIRKSLGQRKRMNPGAQKKGALKPVPRELLRNLSSPPNSPLKLKGTLKSRRESLATPTRPFTEPHAETGETDELADPTPKRTNPETLTGIPSNPRHPPAGNVLVPNRVFASWPGSHYYPATCIGRSTLRQLRIRYDDGNVTSLDATQVRALDLRIGDLVKVDEKGMKKHTYVIIGFKDKIDDLEGEEFPTTDRLGFATLVLEEKRNDPLPQSKTDQSAEQISVPMASVYLPTGLWTRLRDRSFSFSPLGSPAKSASRVGTPVAEPLVLSSFTRRGIAAPSLLKDVSTRAASVASTSRSGTGTFSNMAFVLTSTAADIDKATIARDIKINGGLVLEQGFHELFEDDAVDSPSFENRRQSTFAVEGSMGLVLKPAYKDLGFVALISDSHSRSTKYVQALALNVPCLHLRWIDDSLSASRALPFSRYLLPAGVSKFLDANGVIRSRTMKSYDPASDDISFAQMLQDRDRLLHDQSVLLVTGKSKREIEKSLPFVFLTNALGAANVGRCPDLTVASKMVHDSQWDWVYVDSGEKALASAAAELFGTEKPSDGSKTKKGKKRKRDESEDRDSLVVRGDIDGHRVRVTCGEFVIQSLILGALVDE